MTKFYYYKISLTQPKSSLYKFFIKFTGKKISNFNLFLIFCIIISSQKFIPKGEKKLSEITSYKLASVIAKLAENKFASDIVILDISNVSVLADYFVICSADTTTQVKAITENTREEIKRIFERIPAKNDFDKKNRWNLIDYGDVIVHILHREEREFYAIEKFWNHACMISKEDWEKESSDIELLS